MPPLPKVVIFLSSFVEAKNPVIHAVKSGSDFKIGTKFSFTRVSVSSNKGKALTHLKRNIWN